MGTLTYAIRRILLAVPTLFGITLVTFGIIALAPGDPAALQAQGITDPKAQERLLQDINERFHLDEPVPVRYALWMGEMLRGDLGPSIADRQPVARKIADAFWPTMSVNFIGLLIAFVLSVPIGIFSAWHQNGWFDKVSAVILYALFSIPSYVGAIVLILWVSVRWDLLPFRGMRGDDYYDLSSFGQVQDVAAHMTLYVVAVAYGTLAYYARFVRSNLLEVTRQEYVRTARAKGVKDSVVVVKHAFRNTLIPFITMIGLVVPGLISGSVILEVIFTWPGMGRLFFDSILQRDYPVVMALSTATAVLVLIATLLADLAYGFVDPRVSHA